MTLIEAHEVEPDAVLVDLEDQTTPITGADLPKRVTVVEAMRGHVGALVTVGSATALSVDVWAAAKHEPLSLGSLRRRDQAFVCPRDVTVFHYFDPEGTPAVVLDDIDLVRFETCHDIAFATTLKHWRNLLLGHLGETFETPQSNADPPTPPAAWTAFKELGTWLSLSDRETAQLLGLGDKTAYGWRARAVRRNRGSPVACTRRTPSCGSSSTHSARQRRIACSRRVATIPRSR